MAQRVKEGFSFDHQGVPVTLRRGQLLADDHPYVRGHETHFELADDAALGASPARAVETASAAPGSARTISRQERRRGDGKGEE